MSIDVNVQNDLVIVTESSEDITVNVSNAAGPAGVGVPVGGTTGQVLKKFTNTNYDTYWAADASGLTSVGLSMPSAFAVSNSPLTSNGTIAVTGAGTASQYVRGDGSLATLPSNSSGGSSVAYYLNGSVAASVGTYYQMSKTAVIGTGTDFSKAGNGLISQFLTDVADPNRLEIPAGAWNFEMYFSASSSGGTPAFYVELLKYNGTTFTSIASSSAVPEAITSGTIIDLYLTSLAIPQTTLLSTDRLAIRVYIVNSTGGRTITMHTENSHLCEIITNFAGGVSALNGLTANTQYFATGTSGTDFAISSATDTHTFNLPTASATNRGALSSADWSTFSGKVGGSGTSGQVAYWDGTSSQTGSNNLFWDAANARLGIGTNTPSVDLHLKKAGTVTSTIETTTSTGRTITQIASSISNYLDWRSHGASFTSETWFGQNSASLLTCSSNGGKFVIGTYDSRDFILGTANTERARFFATGNFIVGGTTDGGQRLQVIGDAFIKGSGATSATTGLTVQNSSSTNLFRLRNDGVAILGSGGALYLAAANDFLFLESTTGSGSKNNFVSYLQTSHTSGTNNGILSNGQYTISSGSGVWNLINIAPGINQTGTATGITRGLYVNPTLTAAADWRSIEWSNNSGWGLYGAGTANNYLGGNLGIGSASLSNANLAIEKNISGSTSAYGVLLNSVIQSGVTANAYGFRSLLTTQAASFTLSNIYHFVASQTTQGAGSIVLNQIGFECGDMNNAYTNIAYRGQISQGTLQWNLYMNGTASNYLAGQLLIGTTTKGTFALDVNGTARVSGNTTISLNQNAETSLTIANTNSGSSSVSVMYINSDAAAGSFQFGKYSTNRAVYKIFNPKDAFIYNGTAGDISILNEVGAIKFAAGGSSTAHMTIKSNGRINMSSLPTSSAGLSTGDLWNNLGILSIA